MSKYSSKQKLGFTLIEMAVVLLIIGVLAGIVLRNIGTQGVDARDKRRIADLNNLGIQLVQYSNIMGTYPTTAASGTNSGWTDSFKAAFGNANLSTQLPLPPTSNSGDVYHYFPCSRGGATGTAFVLRAKLEQSANTAPALYRQSYNSSSEPSGWSCTAPNGTSFDCQASNNYFCYTQ
ncbi:MAG: hypothetical protein KatS3mg097_265 [Candidatus Parcubacteria bacterium]|nr:MAG: hypothetical protein KatS3mg097_265 [Candidatus Parcubacteria bacterium]